MPEPFFLFTINEPDSNERKAVRIGSFSIPEQARLNRQSLLAFAKENTGLDSVQQEAVEYSFELLDRIFREGSLITTAGDISPLKFDVLEAFKFISLEDSTMAKVNGYTMVDIAWEQLDNLLQSPGSNASRGGHEQTDLNGFLVAPGADATIGLRLNRGNLSGRVEIGTGVNKEVNLTAALVRAVEKIFESKEIVKHTIAPSTIVNLFFMEKAIQNQKVYKNDAPAGKRGPAKKSKRG